MGSAEGSVRARDGWREVSAAQFGLVPGPHCLCTRAAVLWKAEGPFMGIFATAPQSIEDVEDQWRALDAWKDAGRPPAAAFCDARSFRTAGPPGPLMQHMLARGPQVTDGVLSVVSRAATLLPVDWTRAWWSGALQMGWAGRLPTLATDDPAAAWRWLGAPADLPERVAALTAAASNDDRMRRSAESHLRAEPALDLDALALRLGTSARSLQRELARAGESFVELRARIRFEHAATQIVHTEEKIDAIGAAVGFRSRSHFVSWFRQQTGATPAAFRERARVG